MIATHWQPVAPKQSAKPPAPPVFASFDHPGPPAPLKFTPLPTTQGMHEPCQPKVEPWPTFEAWPGCTVGVRRPIAEVALSPEEWAVYMRLQ